MIFLFNRNSSPWALNKIIFDIIIIIKPFDLGGWFLLTIGSMVLTTYINMVFFSTITVDVKRGLQLLALLMIFENVIAYCQLQQNQAKKTFVLDFVKHFQTKLNQRILSANWIKIKLSDQVEIRRKIEEASGSIQSLIDYGFYQLIACLKLIMTVLTIFYICPMATVFIIIVYVCFYRFYLSKKSNDVLAMKMKLIDANVKVCSKYSRANENMFEYLIHHEKKKIIDITNELKVEMEKKWYIIQYLYEQLSCKENIVGKLCIFLTILIYVLSSETTAFIIPLYHYISTLTDGIDNLLFACIQCSRFIKDYTIIIPILEEYEERNDVEQVPLKYKIHIQDLSFNYVGARETFHLALSSSLTFKLGQIILVKGNSGAGKLE
jgi:ABC-type multidrug transport system fused ATPase/permease subunit